MYPSVAMLVAFYDPRDKLHFWTPLALEDSGGGGGGILGSQI